MFPESPHGASLVRATDVNSVSTTKTPAALAAGASDLTNCVGLVGADVDGAEGHAVRGEHAAGLVAAVVAATDVADAKAEAMAPVVVMPSTTPIPATPIPTLEARRSGGGSQRQGAEGRGGNESESDLTKHGSSPDVMRLRRFVLARVKRFSCSVTHRLVSRSRANAGSRKARFDPVQFSERLFRCEKHHTAQNAAANC